MHSEGNVGRSQCSSKSPMRSSARLQRRRSRSRVDQGTAAEVAAPETPNLDILSLSERSRRASDLLATHLNMSWAHSAPRQYTRVLSHVMVTVELAAMITPLIAIGMCRLYW
jgi:hypothetical protein